MLTVTGSGVIYYSGDPEVTDVGFRQRKSYPQAKQCPIIY
jgi:hypothetical protein